MSDDDRLTTDEMVRLGILQEANRLFFYPLGLALMAGGIPAPDGALRVRRRTGDPHLIVHGDATPTRIAKAATVRAMAEAVAQQWQSAGHAPADFGDGVPIGSLDSAALTAALNALAVPFMAGLITQACAIADPSGEALDAMAGPATIGAETTLAQSIAASACEAFVAGVLAPILDAITVSPGVLPRASMRALQSAAVEDADPSGTDPVARQIARLAQRIRMTREAQEQYRQMTAAEIADLDRHEMVVREWQGVAEYLDNPDNPPTCFGLPPPDVLRRAFLAIEDLYGRAQPGMLFFKGDRDAREKWHGVAAAMRAEMATVIGAQTDTARFLAGRIGAADVADRAAVGAEIEARAAPMRDRLAQLQSDADGLADECAQIRMALAPLESAADRLVSGTAVHNPSNREK